MARQTTITLSEEVKSVLAQAKGERSWDEFLGDVAVKYADEAIALAEKRLKELRAQKVRALSMEEVRAMHARQARRCDMDAGIPPGGRRRARRPSSK